MRSNYFVLSAIVERRVWRIGANIALKGVVG